jgi:hypothetical protein
VTLAVQLLKSVKAEADGTTATLTAQIETTPAAILSLPMLSDAELEGDDADDAPHPRLRRTPKPE